MFRDIPLISQQLGFIVTVRNRIARADFVTHEKKPTYTSWPEQEYMKKLRENLLGLFIVLRNNYNHVQFMDSFIDKFTMVEFERQNTAF